MNIAIVGYGKMGKMVREAALSEGHSISVIVDPFLDESVVHARSVEEIDLETVDVAIDFSTREVVLENIKFYAASGLPAVIGTTGWYDRLEEVKKSINTKRCSIIYSGNFSLGVAVLLKTASYLSHLMNKIESYDVAIEEIHHTAKADSPSGTAEMIKDEVLKNIDRKKYAIYGNSDGKIEPEALQISSVRLGHVCGIHTLLFDGPSDTIELKHTARDRRGFADGSVKAASWLVNKKGFFSMSDFINDFLGE